MSLISAENASLVNINIADNPSSFHVGDTVTGTAEIALPDNIPIANVNISFHCRGEVNWEDFSTSPHSLNSFVYTDKCDYHEEMLKFEEGDVKVVPLVGKRNIFIPFSFTIPKDKNLPSTIIDTHGFVKYYVRVGIKDIEKDEFVNFIKEQLVLAPMDNNLMITVGGSAEKLVLLHGGNVSMNASIARKGFAPGETITVHVNVDNKSNTKVVPRISLHQVQIFMSGLSHRTVEKIFPEESIMGSEIAPGTQVEELLDVTIPENESLSLKSSLITVKYFVHVTLDIPHSFDLHVNLPIVLTTQKVIAQLRNSDRHIEMLTEK